MLNSVVVMGRLTADPELRHTPNDIAVTSFTIAHDRAFKSQGGERQADFFDCVAWRNNAEFITKYFKKGSMIAVNGTLQTRTYTDKNGNNRKAVEIVVDNAHFCEGKRDSGGNPAFQGEHTASAPESFSNGSNADFEEVADEEELPF